jgi:hypothetical protein
MYNFFAIIFLITYEHHILNFLNFLKVIFYFIYIMLFKYSKNIQKCEHMEYIRDKIILVTKFENLHIYLKSRGMSGIFG